MTPSPRPPSGGDSRVSLRSVVAALSSALDLGFAEIAAHHARVAHLSALVGRAVGLGAGELFELHVAASLHDLGAIGQPEMRRLAEFDVESPWEHCQRGAELMAGCEVVSGLAEVIRCHHDHWAGGNASGRSEASIPLASRILFLADRVDCLCRHVGPVSRGRDEVLARVGALAGTSFDPRLVEALGDVAVAESFWRDDAGQDAEALAAELGGGPGDRLLAPGALHELAGMFSRVIDGKSPFTREHSAFVAAVAERLGPALGFDARARSDLVVAALLHDLGKMAVPEAILTKPAPLTEGEWEVVRRHASETDRILGRIQGVGDVRPWAAHHHERIDGRGYPFGLDGRSLSLGARVLSVCDQWAALVEARPYRGAMEREEVARTLQASARGGGIDPELVALLLERHAELVAAPRPAPRPGGPRGTA